MRNAGHGWPLFQIAENFLRGGYAGEMSRKLVARVREQVLAPREDPLPWLRAHCEDLADYCGALDPALWREAESESARLARRAEGKLRPLDVDFGGAASLPLIYFLVRRMQATTVVETGVAVGHSSQAILTALQRNGAGRLYSSDLPLFRIKHPERYIGLLVEDALRADWTLLKAGDRRNLPEILAAVTKIDLFHYDSDVSRQGREWTMDLVLPRIRKGGAVIVDDVEDNCWFEHFVRATGAQAKVFLFEGKYVGLFFVQ